MDAGYRCAYTAADRFVPDYTPDVPVPGGSGEPTGHDLTERVAVLERKFAALKAGALMRNPHQSLRDFRNQLEDPDRQRHQDDDDRRQGEAPSTLAPFEGFFRCHCRRLPTVSGSLAEVLKI